MHYINLAQPAPMLNDPRVIRGFAEHVASLLPQADVIVSRSPIPVDDPTFCLDSSPYVSAAPIRNTAQYLEGWSFVATCGDDESEISLLWHMADGSRSDFERGVIDAIDAAYGSLADPAASR